MTRPPVLPYGSLLLVAEPPPISGASSRQRTCRRSPTYRSSSKRRAGRRGSSFSIRSTEGRSAKTRSSFAPKWAELLSLLLGQERIMLQHFRDAIINKVVPLGGSRCWRPTVHNARDRADTARLMTQIAPSDGGPDLTRSQVLRQVLRDLHLHLSDTFP